MSNTAEKVEAAAPRLVLNKGQVVAKLEILKAYAPKGRHLLTGWAGSGKSTLMEEVARELGKKRKVVLTAPTHKAVAVLAKKMEAAGLAVPCMTTHSLLSLEVKAGENGKTVLERRKHPQPVDAEVVIIDETSMVDSELYRHIQRHLHHCFVLFVGDPAQLPPVGETESPTFQTKARSHLDEIVRQEADNPILAAATVIRHSQGKEADWSWAKSANVKPRGVYVPQSGALDLWLKKAFTSAEFDADNDTFRYLCWRNDRVAQVNEKIRKWRYGDTDTPFSPGELALVRQPIIRDKVIVYNTNQEVPVHAIREGTYQHFFEPRAGLDEWSVEIPSWQIDLGHKDALTRVHMPRAEAQRLVNDINDKLVSEAHINRDRWGDRFRFHNSMAKLQSVYAMTVHTSQGSTFKSVFVDVADIRHSGRRNTVLEMQQMLYVACTRPTTGLYLVGVK